jgi:hypothetical protein
LTSLKKCQLQSEKNLDKLIFSNQNRPNDPRVGYMVEFIEKDEIVKELKEFEREFEREKIVDMKFCYINKTIFLYLLIYLVHHLL